MAVTGACDAEILANELLTSLTAGKDFEFPDVDLNTDQFKIPVTTIVTIEPKALSNEDITTKQVDGTGTFDVIMSSMAAHLKEEFSKGRITGEQYTKAYIAVTESALGNSIQFLMGKDASYWQAVQAQFQAQAAQLSVVTARVELEATKIKLQTMRYEAHLIETNYAIAKLKLATESVTYCTGKFQLEEMLPEQKLMLIAQREAAEEQVEVARAQTLNTRSDGTLVQGVVGKQRDLYSQQITSYKRDAETKVMKIFTDAWITMKGLDEGLLPPTPFTNNSLNGMLDDIKVRVGLGEPTQGYVPNPEPVGGYSPTVVNTYNNGDGTTTTTYSNGSYGTAPNIP